MFRATRLLMALIAIVALGAGALLLVAGQGPSPLPTRSPSPTPSAASGRDWIVAQDGSGDASSVADALALAVDGDRVLVRPGTYRGGFANVKDVAIAGDGDPASIILHLTGGTAFEALLLQDTDASLSGLTISSEGDRPPAVWLSGGAPSLHDLIVGSSALPVEIDVIRGSRAVLRQNSITGRIGVSDGSTPTIESNQIMGPGARLDIGGAGTDPVIRGNVLRSSGISVSAGASPLIEDNELHDGTGLDVSSDATPTISGNTITRAATGIGVDRAEPTLRGNTILDGGVGVSISYADPSLTGNTVRGNATGIAVLTGAAPTLEGNVVEGNDIGLSVDNGVIVRADGSRAAAVFGSNSICGNGTDVATATGASLVRQGGGTCEGAAATALASNASGGPGPSLSPTTTPASSAPTLALVTAPVEPGVVKVLGDGAGHDLEGMPLDGVAIGPDGTVWLLGTVPVGPGARPQPDDLGVNGILALGRPGTYEAGPLTGAGRPDLAVAWDGTLWAVDEDQLHSFDGRSWTVYRLPGQARGVQVSAVGTVWAAWDAGSRPEAGYLGPAGWSTIATSASPATDGGSGSFAVTPDGEAWLGVAFYKVQDAQAPGASRWRGLLRSTDRSGWVVEHPLGERDDLSTGPMAAGSDGTLWVYEAIDDFGYDAFSQPERYLLRHDANDWTAYSTDDGVPLLVGHATFRATLAVAGDGTLWITNTEGVLPPELGPHTPGDCPGVLSFDGTTWRQYLVGTCVNHVAFGADGAVWATSDGGRIDGSDVPERAGLYLIRPDAAGAATP